MPARGSRAGSARGRTWCRRRAGRGPARRSVRRRLRPSADEPAPTQWRPVRLPRCGARRAGVQASAAAVFRWFSSEESVSPLRSIAGARVLLHRRRDAEDGDRAPSKAPPTALATAGTSELHRALQYARRRGLSPRKPSRSIGARSVVGQLATQGAEQGAKFGGRLGQLRHGVRRRHDPAARTGSQDALIGG